MRSICAAVLTTRLHSTNLRVNEVLINLSLFNESSLTTSAAHTTCYADMEKQARVLVAQMAAPKTVRMLTHGFPSITMRTFDVLNGKNLTLSEGAEWDDDGEAIEDELSDEELEISDLSSDDDG
ncbi:hypothetical protein DE146DRAFT_743441 [Phaeosphaeria sp. MPI-PUGE-AT-0046c]|nr:hypothetical protein DE146DRAFT_743441 [Phaeosphaeria sp. MPI-PUGE-AT-0046c]